MLWAVRVLVQRIVHLHWGVVSIWVGHFGVRSDASLTDMGPTLFCWGQGWWHFAIALWASQAQQDCCSEERAK